MVSLSTGLTLGLIGAAVLGFYKLGGASGIGSRLGGGFSSLFDSFSSSLNPIQAAIDKNNAENPALDPVLVAQARFEEATTLDPNLAADRFVDPAGIYDPYTTVATPVAPTPVAPTPVAPTPVAPTPQTQVPIISRKPALIPEPIPESSFTVTTVTPTGTTIAPYFGAVSPTPITKEVTPFAGSLEYIFTNNRGLNSTRSTRYG